MTHVAALAPAKVNLFLHVGPVDAEGYHPLCSLVAFADVGDRLTVRRAETLTLDVGGPTAAELDGSGDNLVLRALRRLAETSGPEAARLAVTLEKHLPVAAGLGGGSSDAGAALRLAAALASPPVTEEALEIAAAVVGADGAMCLHARSAWAEGRGERLTFEPALPSLEAVLVNPGVPSPTGAVYRAYDATGAAKADRPAAPTDWTAPTVIAWLSTLRNDLEAPALALQPAIAEAMRAVAAQTGVGLTRMSGSGATVFGLFENSRDADTAAERLSRGQACWWVRRAVLGRQGPQSSY